MKLSKNEGNIDRGVRVSLGIVFLALSVFFPPFALVFVIIAVVLLATGALGFCGLYRLFGINTCSIKK